LLFVNVYKINAKWNNDVIKYEMLRNIASDNCHNRNARDERMNKLFGVLSIEGADCCLKKIRKR
jgi:hypothetical protein